MILVNTVAMATSIPGRDATEGVAASPARSASVDATSRGEARISVRNDCHFVGSRPSCGCLVGHPCVLQPVEMAVLDPHDDLAPRVVVVRAGRYVGMGGEGPVGQVDAG